MVEIEVKIILPLIFRTNLTINSTKPVENCGRELESSPQLKKLQVTRHKHLEAILETKQRSEKEGPFCR